jgi:regulator of sirC expression with transglutaminase-like and TPR domain
MNTSQISIALEDSLKQAAVKAEGGNYLAAVEIYDRVIEIDPECATAYGNRALIRANLGNKQGAIEDLRKAAFLFLQQGKTANCEMALERIKSISSFSVFQDN